MTNEQTPNALVWQDESKLEGVALDVAREQLKFHQERIAAGSDLVSSIGQFIFIIFGALVVAAAKIPVVIVVLPLIWTAWFFHALQRSLDTQKHLVMAQRLEKQIDRSIGDHNVAIWISSQSAAAVRHPPTITWLNAAYWGLLYIVSWVTALIVLFTHDHATLGFLTLAMMAALVVTGAIALRDDRNGLSAQRAIVIKYLGRD